MLSCVCLLRIELLEWVVHLQNVHSDELKLAVTKIMTCHLFVGVFLLLQHLLLDIIDVFTSSILTVNFETSLLVGFFFTSKILFLSVLLY